MRWYGVFIASLIILTPLTGFAAGKLSVAVDSEPLTTKFEQIGKMTTASITHNVYYDANTTKAVNDTRVARALAYRTITDAVNEFKARYDANLVQGGPNEADDASKSAIKLAIYEVEITAQQTLQKIDAHIQKMTSLPAPTVSPTQLSVPTPAASTPASSINFLRTSLPAQSLSTIYGKQSIAPALTRTYANTGARPFIPVEPALARVSYQLPGAVQRPTFLQSLGIALGGYLGTQNFFAPQPKIKVNKMFGGDPKQYTVTLSAVKGQSTTLTVPDYLTPTLVQDVKPGVYEVFYKTVGESGAVLSAQSIAGAKPDAITRIGLGARFPLTITNGQTWCLQVPMPPARCN